MATSPSNIVAKIVAIPMTTVWVRIIIRLFAMVDEQKIKSLSRDLEISYQSTPPANPVAPGWHIECSRTVYGCWCGLIIRTSTDPEATPAQNNGASTGHDPSGHRSASPAAGERDRAHHTRRRDSAHPNTFLKLKNRPAGFHQ